MRYIPGPELRHKEHNRPATVETWSRETSQKTLRQSNIIDLLYGTLRKIKGHWPSFKCYTVKRFHVQTQKLEPPYTV